MATVEIAGIEVEVHEPVEGFRVISALAHELIFEDGTVIPPNPALAKLIKASKVEEIVKQVGGVTLTKVIWRPHNETLSILNQLMQDHPDVYVISSGIAVEAYRGYGWTYIVGPITTEETSRLPNDQKRVYRDKWSA